MIVVLIVDDIDRHGAECEGRRAGGDGGASPALQFYLFDEFPLTPSPLSAILSPLTKK